MLGREREIRHKKNQLYHILVHDASANIHGLLAEKAKADDEFARRRAFLQEEEAQLERMVSGNSALSEEHERLKSALQKNTAELAAFERRDIKLKENLKHVTAQMKKFDTAIGRDSKKEADSVAELEQLNKQVLRFSPTYSLLILAIQDN